MKSERVQALTETYLSTVEAIDVNKLIFIDESGANQNLILNYGRSLSGKRAYDEQPVAKGKRVSTIGALSCRGMEVCMCFEGTLNREVFKQFLSQVLLPELKQGDVIIMDNASVHHHESIVQLIESKGARALYLPPYSPHLNPIENAWSKMKHSLRKARARTTEALYDAWAQAIDSITPQDAKGYFQNAGLMASS
jgi:transposase